MVTDDSTRDPWPSIDGLYLVEVLNRLKGIPILPHRQKSAIRPVGSNLLLFYKNTGLQSYWAQVWRQNLWIQKWNTQDSLVHLPFYCTLFNIENIISDEMETPEVGIMFLYIHIFNLITHIRKHRSFGLHFRCKLVNKIYMFTSSNISV